MMDEYRVAVSESAIDDLGSVAHQLAQVDTTTRENAQLLLPNRAQLHSYPNVRLFAEQLQTRLTQFGFAVVDFNSLAQHVDLRVDRTIMTALLAAIGNPVQIFNNWPLWKPIYTDTDIEPSRAGGTGFIPLHMDFVNAEHPPEYTCLLCLRDDPLGGGQSNVSQTALAIDSLTSSQRSLLSDRAFNDGQVINLSHVGSDINPFAVYDPDSRWPVRFTAKMLLRMVDSPHKNALSVLDEHLRLNEVRFPLRPLELLIVDQRKAVHGREPLALNQVLLPPDDRRLLHQIFLCEYRKL